MTHDSASPPLAARPRPPISRAKKVLFALAAIALPFAAFALAEIGLRAFTSFGGYAPTLVDVGPLNAAEPQGPHVVIADKAGPATFFFANRERSGSLFEASFLSPKPPGTFRVFLVGESAAQGFPQPPALAASAFLEAMLQDAWPDRRVEVINLGVTAVASFPVLQIAREALEHQPDLIIAYVGNNEFFGAFGVASLHSAGRSPAAIRFIRALRSVALVQGLDELVQLTGLRGGDGGEKNRTLMELMVGQTYTAPDDPIRDDAARNLRVHLEEFIAACRSAAVPIVVCTLPANEADLAPLGDSENGVARTRFDRGRELFARGEHAAALAEFQAAIDADPMPWRAPSAADAAIRAAVSAGAASAGPGAVLLADLRGAFRAASPGGITGWDLMDDHVHPSLRGQALIAETIVRTLADDSVPAPLRVPEQYIATMPPWDRVAQELGANEFDRFGVAHTVRVLSDIPFYRSTNPGAFARFDEQARRAIGQQPPSIVEAMTEWMKPTTHAGGKRPITSMVGRVLLREGQPQRAAELYDFASRNVPAYSSWNLEYVYFALASRVAVNGSASEADLQAAQDAIERGALLLRRGASRSGLTERYMGRLHQLRREWSASIPLLLAARPKMSAEDLVATDQALAEAYVRSERFDDARALIERGIKDSGRFAPVYMRMRDALDRAVKAAPGGR